MNYQIGEEVIVELMGTVCKVEKGSDNKLYYTVEVPNHTEFARVQQSRINLPLRPEDLKCQS